MRKDKFLPKTTKINYV